MTMDMHMDKKLENSDSKSRLIVTRRVYSSPTKSWHLVLYVTSGMLCIESRAPIIMAAYFIPGKGAGVTLQRTKPIE